MIVVLITGQLAHAADGASAEEAYRAREGDAPRLMREPLDGQTEMSQERCIWLPASVIRRRFNQWDMPYYVGWRLRERGPGEDTRVTVFDVDRLLPRDPLEFVAVEWTNKKTYVIHLPGDGPGILVAKNSFLYQVIQMCIVTLEGIDRLRAMTGEQE